MKVEALAIDRRTHCPVCAGGRVRVVRKKCGFDIARCADCRSEFAVLSRADLPDYEDHYRPDGIYRTYHAMAAEHAAGHRGEAMLYWYQHRMLEEAGPGEGRLHLDVGSGFGYFSNITRGKGWRVMGVDVSRTAAQGAKETFGIETHLGGLDDIPLPDGSVAWISAFEVLEHAIDPRAFAAACQRLLEPGGLVTISVPNGLSRDERNTLHPRQIPPTHVTFFSRCGLNQLFEDAGFRRVYDYEKPLAWGELTASKWAKMAMLPWLLFDAFILGNRGNRLLWVGRKKGSA